MYFCHRLFSNLYIILSSNSARFSKSTTFLGSKQKDEATEIVKYIDKCKIQIYIP